MTAVLHENATMQPRYRTHMKTPSEIWDDDFDFRSANDHDDDNDLQRRRGPQPPAHDNTMPTLRNDPEENTVTPFQSTSTRQSSSGTQQHRQQEENPLWTEPGPSRLPRLLAAAAPTRPSGVKPSSRIEQGLREWAETGRRGGPSQKAADEDVEEENWDDDFEDKVYTPARPRKLNTPDFGSPESPLRGRSRTNAAASWDSSDDDADFGFHDRAEEDKTLTSKHRGSFALGPLPSIPIPPIPQHDPSNPAPFPRSPTLSAFSVPSSGQDTASLAYGSTAHLALGRTHSGSSSRVFANLPPSPPVHRHRERRRLRKKSRPPHLDGNIMELEDRDTFAPLHSIHMPNQNDERPVTPPPRNQTLLQNPSAPVAGPSMTPSPVHIDIASPSSPNGHSASPNSKAPILTRIGSITRWGRKKRMSTGPNELVAFSIPPTDQHGLQDTHIADPAAHEPRVVLPPSVTEQTPRRGVGLSFFREGDEDGEHAPPRELIKQRSKERVSLKMQRSWSSSHSRTNSPTPNRSRRQRGDNSPLVEPVPRISDVSSGRSSEQATTDLETTDSEAHPRSNRRPNSKRGSTHRQVSSPFPSGPFDPAATPNARRGSSSKHDRTPNGTRRSVSASHAIPPSPSAVEEVHSDHNHDGVESGRRSIIGGIRRISLLGGKKQKTPPRAPARMPDDVPPLPTHSSGTTPKAHRSPRPSGDSYAPRLSEGTVPVPALPPADGKAPPPVPTASTPSTPSKAMSTSTSMPSSISAGRGSPNHSSVIHSKSTSFATLNGKTSPGRSPNSPAQVASLGRSTVVQGASPHTNGNSTGAGAIPRRNSLGDLKIPSRISKAQDNLKRDLNRVKEFAACIEQLKSLRHIHNGLLQQLQAHVEAPESRPPSRAMSPTSFFNLNIPRRGRMRSNTNPTPSVTSPSAQKEREKRQQVTNQLMSIQQKYRIAWECADLLINIGGGSPDVDPSGPTAPPLESHSSAPVTTSNSKPPVTPSKGRDQRERAITLTGGRDTPKPKAPVAQSSPAFSDSKHLDSEADRHGHDLSRRQLYLLREMLNNAESVKAGVSTDLDLPDMTGSVAGFEIAMAKYWQVGAGVGEGMSSTITFGTNTEERSSTHEKDRDGLSPDVFKKRRSSKMIGLKEILKSLRRLNAKERHDGLPSSTNSTDSSLPQTHPPIPGLPPDPSDGPTSRLTGRRRAKTSVGPDSVMTTNTAHSSAEQANSTQVNNPYVNRASLVFKSSPRRPSLASLFRLGQKGKTVSAAAAEQAQIAAFDEEKLSSHEGLGTRPHSRTTTTATEEDDYSDWDRMDSFEELGADQGRSSFGAPEKTATLRAGTRRGHKTILGAEPPWDADSLHVNVPDGHAGARQSRLSNVTEDDSGRPSEDTRDKAGRRSLMTPERRTSQKRRSLRPGSRQGRNTSSLKPVSPSQMSATVRSAPPMEQNPSELDLTTLSLTDSQLAMTPENIKPLLDNAKVVETKLGGCLDEIRTLLSTAADEG